jgi:hypothetical protein
MASHRTEIYRLQAENARLRERAERAERERDAIARLCYRKVETEDLDRETYYVIAILHLCLGPETYDTEPEVVAAARRLAGLDAAPAGEETPP